MKLTAGRIPGLFTVDSPRHEDPRGSFQRAWCRDSFREAGVDFDPVQGNISENTALHTLRGLHFQRPPHAEAKLVRCISGRVWDVAVDLRRGPGFGRWEAVELDAARGNAVFLPEGLAHGFLTLTPGAVILYAMGRSHVPGRSEGIRWDDPSLEIPWPFPPAVLSDADAGLPSLRDVAPVA